MRKVIFGIDPDCEMSGLAKIEKPFPLELCVVKFFDLFEYLNKAKELEVDIKIYIEAGWLNKKSNYHGKVNQSKSVGELIAKKVGANHETGRKIVEMCEHLKLPYELVKPTSKKTTPEYFEKLTGIKCKGKFRQEMIDAGMLLIGR